MQVHINGEAREVAAETTLAELLKQLELDPRSLAVERNLDLVPRASHADTIIEEGDRLEIVTLVGGG